MPSPVFSINYIVRIYICEKNKPRSLIGVVEEVGIKGKKAFANLNEIWDILSASKGIKNQRKSNATKTSLMGRS